MPVNYNCDGQNPNCPTNREVRVLPTGGDGNAIVCRFHYSYEMHFRRDRNRELAPDCQFDLPTWESLRVYE